MPGSLSGRSVSARVPGRWQHRLGRLLAFPSARRANEFEHEVLLPALGEIVEELATKDITATCEHALDDDGQEHIELEIDPDSKHPFHYLIYRTESPVPTVGRRLPRGEEKFVRLEVYLDVAAAQGYDIMGYSKEQIIDDVIDQYERHLEFLQMQEHLLNGSEAN